MASDLERVRGLPLEVLENSEVLGVIEQRSRARPAETAYAIEAGESPETVCDNLVARIRPDDPVCVIFRSRLNVVECSTESKQARQTKAPSEAGHGLMEVPYWWPA